MPAGCSTNKVLDYFCNSSPIDANSSQNRPDNFDDIFLTEAFFWKIFEGELLIRSLTTTFFEIFCELLL